MHSTSTDVAPPDIPVTSTGTTEVSVILPVIDETTALQETVRILLAENRQSIREILLIVCNKTTPEALRACSEVTGENPGLVVTYSQRRPHLGGAMQDAFERARGTHLLMMASDLETDPRTVKDLIARAAEGYDIVTATRWNNRGGFRGYDPLKYVRNWFFRVAFAAIWYIIV